MDDGGPGAPEELHETSVFPRPRPKVLGRPCSRYSNEYDARGVMVRLQGTTKAQEQLYAKCAHSTIRCSPRRGEATWTRKETRHKASFSLSQQCAPIKLWRRRESVEKGNLINTKSTTIHF
ncbi:GDP-mannose 4,6 dehydratase 1 [Anopheles sinensis]|uniref:GDP-mannose 4,6 dehydratase 1 n=1 Tax=Anopheles sinensis TaxID=74873 RepID=A0A084VWE0_ANOSI|nr:GDP-mannose 4,6 dehydratase 1 [Anopheles sinensis]